MFICRRMLRCTSELAQCGCERPTSTMSQEKHYEARLGAIEKLFGKSALRLLLARRYAQPDHDCATKSTNTNGVLSHQNLLMMDLIPNGRWANQLSSASCFPILHLA
eukprot:4954043-Amphidinium_carterae.1